MVVLVETASSLRVAIGVVRAEPVELVELVTLCSLVRMAGLLAVLAQPSTALGFLVPLREWAEATRPQTAYKTAIRVLLMEKVEQAV